MGKKAAREVGIAQKNLFISCDETMNGLIEKGDDNAQHN
jgi:hypothetical protein